MSDITLFQGDCIELMNNICEESIDLILCDLPYGKTNCKWDIIIPFESLWKQYNRIIKPNGAIALFGIEPFSSLLRVNNIKDYKYDWIWKKPKGTGFLNAQKQPLRDVEIISIFYKNQCTYNPQLTEGTPYKGKSGKTVKINNKGDTTYGKFFNGQGYRNDNDGFRYPKQVIEFGVVERNTLHPTQKPVELLEYLIKTYTNEEETVLDNCMGSGSTGVACVNTNRNFIGIELNEDYFNTAKQRIKLSKLNKPVKLF